MSIDKTKLFEALFTALIGLILIQQAVCLQLSSNYDGVGDFSLWEEFNGDQLSASGDGDLVAGIDVTDNITWAGFEFSGNDGAFKSVGIFGPVHTMSVRDADNISAQVRTEIDLSRIDFTGFGDFRQAIFDAANSKGRHDKLYDMFFVGELSMNTTVIDDRATVDIMEITEEDLST